MMRPVQIVISALLLLQFAHAPAQASFNIGLAANYAVLTDPRVTQIQLTGSTTINGNVGVGTDHPDPGGSSPGVHMNGVTINGNLDFFGPVNIAGNPGTITGTTTADVANVNTAYSTMSSLSATLGAESGTTLTLTGLAQTINASSGTLDGSGNRVFTASSGFDVTAPLTINGTASDYVVINVTAGQTASFDNNISLTGGITSDHVLYNILATGSSEVVSSGGSFTVYGTILAINRHFNLDDIDIKGRLIGGQHQDFQLTNIIVDQPVVFEFAPEPATFTLWSILGLIGGVAGWRSKRQAA